MGRGGAAGQRGSGAVREEIPGCAQDDPREWQLWIDETPRPGWANMAIDQALLDRAGQSDESWLRLYSWEPHCLSFGRHEPAARRYDTDRIAAMGLDTVRRPTGGRAVWHSRELTYAVAAPCQWFGSLPEAYLEIHAMLADALRAVGIEVSLAPRTRAVSLEAGACFSQPAGGEVMTAGRKVVGSAQFRRGSALLQHGSILLEDEQELVAAITRGRGTNPPTVSGAVLPAFSPKLREALSAGELSEAITTVIQVRWPGIWQRVSNSDELLREASRHHPQFRSPAWTWKR